MSSSWSSVSMPCSVRRNGSGKLMYQPANARPCAGRRRRRPRTGSTDCRHDLVADIEVGIYVLNVVTLFDGVDQLEDLLRAFLVQLHGHAGHERGLGRLVVDAGLLECRPYWNQIARLRDHLVRLAEVVDL